MEAQAAQEDLAVQAEAREGLALEAQAAQEDLAVEAQVAQEDRSKGDSLSGIGRVKLKNIGAQLSEK